MVTSKGVSSLCDCEDANWVNGAWNCLLLLAWYSISSSWVYVLGCAVGATHYSSPCTCQHLTAFPPLFPSLHKYNQSCQESRSAHYHLQSSLTDYAEYAWLCPPIPSHVFKFHCIWLRANICSSITMVPNTSPLYTCSTNKRRVGKGLVFKNV